MIEFENSDNLVERTKYAQFLKDCLILAKDGLRMWELYEDEDAEFKEKYIKLNKDFIERLQKKLDNYDIYRQQFTPPKCSTCGEEQCVCDILRKPVSDEITKEELNKLF